MVCAAETLIVWTLNDRKNTTASGASITTHRSGEPKTAAPRAVSILPLGRVATAADGSLVVASMIIPTAATPVITRPSAIRL